MHTSDGGEVPTDAYTRLTWLEMQGLESSLDTGEAGGTHYDSMPCPDWSSLARACQTKKQQALDDEEDTSSMASHLRHRLESGVILWGAMSTTTTMQAARRAGGVRTEPGVADGTLGKVFSSSPAATDAEPP